MARVYIDVDLNDFETYELLDEIERRYDYSSNKEEISSVCRRIINESDQEKHTIITKSKIEYFLENHEHFTEEMLRNIVNNK